MSVEVTRTGAVVQVLYDCGVQPAGRPYRQCVRATSTNPAVPPSAAAGKLVIDRVLTGTAAAPSHPAVFVFTPDALNPVHASVELVVAAKGARTGTGNYSHQLVLDDGFYMRNLGSQ
jgi:hypothetical protein